MRVSYSSALSLNATAAYQILLSPRLAHARMAELKAVDPHIEEAANGEVIAHFSVPTQLLPEMAQPFVKQGEVLTVRTRPADDSSPEHLRTLSELLPSSLPLEVRITVSVDPSGAEGSVVLAEDRPEVSEDKADVSAAQLTYIAEYSISVPLFGKKLERACQGWINDLLRADAQRVEELGKHLGQ